ncbi:MAG: Sec-independent protein translocase protein TatB [Methylophilaceae bacterium]
MFDISFSELMIVAVVALLVVGPDKLPQVARTVGAFVGRLQRYVAQVKEEVNREVRFEELQHLQQEIKQGASQAKASIMDGADDMRAAVSSAKEAVNPKRSFVGSTSTKTTSSAGTENELVIKKKITRRSATKKPVTNKTTPKKNANDK